MTQTEDEEPALLLTECTDEEKEVIMLNKESVILKFKANCDKRAVTNLWYLDNGASIHMTGLRSKFKELDESVTGKVKFGDGSTVSIQGKGYVIFKCKNREEHVLREVYFIPRTTI